MNCNDVFVFEAGVLVDIVLLSSWNSAPKMYGGYNKLFSHLVFKYRKNT